MFAIVKTGGKQYKVTTDDVLKLEKLPGEVGQVIDLNEVLLVSDEKKGVSLGQPNLKDAVVKVKILEQKKDKKVIIFKKKRRKNHRRKNGHRQRLTVVRIVEISFGGSTVKASEKPAVEKKAPAKSETKPKPVAKEAAVEKKQAEKKPSAKKAASPVKKPASKTTADKEPAAKKPAAKKTTTKKKED